MAILVPVLRRPHNIAPLLASITATTPGEPRVLFIADSDDREEIEELDRHGAEYLALDPPATYARKINAGYRATREPFVLMAADDLRFHDGWLERALAHMQRPGVHVVGTNDLCNPRVMCGQHATHPLIRRAYIETWSGVIDEPDTVLCEQYPHEYCDDELVGTAMARGCYSHAFDSLVEHLHPMRGEAPDDDTYRLGRRDTREGQRIFNARRRLWQ